MELISYFMALVISFLGLFVGYILAYMAKEELKPGEKYLMLLKNLIFALIGGLFAYFLLESILIGVLLFLVLVFISLKFKISTRAIYLLLGVLFFISTNNQNMFLIISLLIFAYGFPTGSLFVSKFIKQSKIKNAKMLFLNHIWYLVTGVLLCGVYSLK